MINKCLKKSTSAELKIAIELNGLFTWNQNRYNAPGWNSALAENYLLKNLKQASIKGNFSWNL